MSGEIGLLRWVSMTAKEQEKHLRTAEENRVRELQKLTYEEALGLTHELLRLLESIPDWKHKDFPRGLGVSLGNKKI